MMTCRLWLLMKYAVLKTDPLYSTAVFFIILFLLRGDWAEVLSANTERLSTTKAKSFNSMHSSRHDIKIRDLATDHVPFEEI